MSDAPDTFGWQATPAQAARSSWGGRRPMGTVTVRTGTDTTTYAVPNAVAKVLAGKEGQEVFATTADELLEVIQALSLKTGRQRLMRLLARRDYSVHEATTKLELDGYDQATIRAVIGEFVGQRLLSDARFADVFVRSKVLAGWGVGRIERELKRRGIDVGAIEGWPDDYLEQDESERALELARRKQVRPPNEFAKLVRFLVNRGFKQSVAYDAARRALDEREE